MSSDGRNGTEAPYSWEDLYKEYEKIGHYKDITHSLREFERYFSAKQNVKVTIPMIPSFSVCGSFSLNQTGHFSVDFAELDFYQDLRIYHMTFDVILYFEEGELILAPDCFFTSNPLYAVLQYRGRIQLNRLFKKGFTNRQWYRSIIPLPKNIELSWEYLIESFPVLIEKQESKSIRIRNLIEFTHDGQIFQIFHVPSESNQYSKFIFIDCLTKMELDSYIRKTTSILYSIGFFTSTDLTDCSRFIVSSDTEDFREVSFTSAYAGSGNEKTMGFSQLISPGQVSRSLAEYDKWSLKHKEVSVCTLKRLINELETNRSCNKIIYDLLINCSNVSTLKVTQLFTSIESARKWDEKTKEENTKSKIDKKTKKHILKEMRTVIENERYASILSEDEKASILQRLPEIFRIPNSRELENIFINNGIALKEYEKRIVSSRNIFLHGEVKFSRDLLIEDKNEEKHLILYQNVLVSLLYRFVLKKIGYEGLVLNTNKIQLSENALFKDESLFFVL